MGHDQEDQYSHYRGPKSRKKRERCRKLIQRNNDCKCPSPGERNIHLDPGNPESCSVEESKETHTGTHYN